ncbi:reverse transcriptase domain-containing protein [Trichonephila clavipes]|nr:reverse transcriptase domain-containing protein [Trichonephila clavipes]
MNIVDNHIVNEAKIACYAYAIAIWHSHTDITISENVLSEKLSHIEDYAKLLINPEKNKYCVFSTDRRSRVAFLPKLSVENIAQKALKKLNILRKFGGSTWGSKPKTLLNTYTALIRPTLEYAAPVWTPSASTSAEKIDSAQYRASKIIIGAVSSTNNVTVENECGLPSLKGRRKLATFKFTNKIRSCGKPHIPNITFRSLTAKNRLKRSSA